MRIEDESIIICNYLKSEKRHKTGEVIEKYILATSKNILSAGAKQN